jgi:hypothetical protein
VALVTQAMAEMRHPAIPPTGKRPRIASDRNLVNDDDLLATGYGRCGEQARISVRLCQACNIPARIIHLFYSNKRSGHTVIEFHADGRWIMADGSWRCVFPGPDGKLMSAAQCHDGGEGQRYCGMAYEKRMHQIAELPPDQLVDKHRTPEQARKYYSSLAAEELARKMGTFGMINHPLPAAGK